MKNWVLLHVKSREGRSFYSKVAPESCLDVARQAYLALGKHNMLRVMVSNPETKESLTVSEQPWDLKL